MSDNSKPLQDCHKYNGKMVIQAAVPKPSHKVPKSKSNPVSYPTSSHKSKKARTNMQGIKNPNICDPTAMLANYKNGSLRVSRRSSGIMNYDTLGLNVEGADHIETENVTSMETPHLGTKDPYKSGSDNSGESFLNKHSSNNNSILSNHLYKFSAPVYKTKQKNEMLKLAPSQIQAEQDLHDIFIEGRNSVDVKNNNPDLRRTPMNINQRVCDNINYFDVPLQHHNSAAKFQTPSTGGESITTATSIRKISSKIVTNYGIKSPADSRCDSINTEVGIRLRYTPESANKNNLMKQSLERIDNAVKRYGSKINTNNMPAPFDMTNRVQLQQLRDYLQSEEGSCPDDYLAGHIMLSQDPVENRQAFSENVSNSIVCDSENANIENFTLGPDQFAKIKQQNPDKGAARNLISEFRKEAENRKSSGMQKKRRSINKYPSADQRHTHKNGLMNSNANFADVVLTNHNSGSKYGHMSEPRDSFMKQTRGSAPSLKD
jgi:hypothetical protein